MQRQQWPARAKTRLCPPRALARDFECAASTACEQRSGRLPARRARSTACQPLLACWLLLRGATVERWHSQRRPAERQVTQTANCAARRRQRFRAERTVGFTEPYENLWLGSGRSGSRSSRRNTKSRGGVHAVVCGQCDATKLTRRLRGGGEGLDGWGRGRGCHSCELKRASPVGPEWPSSVQWLAGAPPGLCRCRA